MGAAGTKGKPDSKEISQEKGFEKKIDKIATQYILTQNFEDLNKLEDPKYCERLVILTSKIMDRFLDEREVQYMSQRMERGVKIDKITKEKLIFFNKDNSKKLDVKGSLKKRRMCEGISLFYVKIGHLFAAILKTLNPEYTYKDQMGIERRISILDKKKIPAALFKDPLSKVKIHRVEGDNLCSRRLKALTPHVTVPGNPKHGYNLDICNINKPKSQEKGQLGPVERVRKFYDQIGIPELDTLYYDEYSLTKKQWVKSENAKKEYKNDVDTFYKTFTGETSVPGNIVKFSQIPLADFHNKPLCHYPEGILSKTVSYDTSTELYKAYADHLKKMMADAITNQNKLIAILDAVFYKEFNKSTEKVEYSIRPKLTKKKLDEEIAKARKLIVELYNQCEKDFRKGIKLIEAVIEKKEQVRNKNRQENLEKQFDSLLK